MDTLHLLQLVAGARSAVTGAELIQGAIRRARQSFQCLRQLPPFHAAVAAQAPGQSLLALRKQALFKVAKLLGNGLRAMQR
ncbi:hypothetical protein D9M72_399180 [compost metagenome]